MAGCAPLKTDDNAPPASNLPVSSPLPTAKALPAGQKLPLGQALFEANCLVCHSPGSMPRGIDTLVKHSRRFASADAFAGYLRHPGLGMPAFTPDQLSEAEIQQLYAYVQREYGQ